MFDILKNSLENYRKEQEINNLTPFVALKTKLTNHRVDTYNKMVDKTKELLDILEQSTIDNLSTRHNINTRIGVITYDINYYSGEKSYDNTSGISLDVYGSYMNYEDAQILINPNKDSDVNEKIETMSKKSAALLDFMTEFSDELFNDIENSLSDEISRQISKLRQPREELLNTLNNTYNDNEYEVDYDYDDR